MSVKDILLPLISYPVATKPAAIEGAVDLAQYLGAHLSAIVNEMEVSPAIGAVAKLQDIDAIIDAEFAKNRKQVREVIADFERAANTAGVPHDHIVARCMPAGFPDRIVKEAHLRDLAVLAIDGKGAQQSIVEALVFTSGRPVLIFPEEPTRELPRSLNNIALAWDFSGPATRAIADALPLLKQAKTVRICTVIDDKALHGSYLSITLPDHLAKHGVKAVWDEVRSNGGPIGKVFATYVVENRVDLFAMGAYGHSRLREFVLGGATRSMIEAPPTWVLLSR